MAAHTAVTVTMAAAPARPRLVIIQLSPGLRSARSRANPIVCSQPGATHSDEQTVSSSDRPRHVYRHLCRARGPYAGDGRRRGVTVTDIKATTTDAGAPVESDEHSLTV